MKKLFHPFFHILLWIKFPMTLLCLILTFLRGPALSICKSSHGNTWYTSLLRAKCNSCHHKHMHVCDSRYVSRIACTVCYNIKTILTLERSHMFQPLFFNSSFFQKLVHVPPHSVWAVIPRGDRYRDREEGTNGLLGSLLGSVPVA
jgi:hypothetical protein